MFAGIEVLLVLLALALFIVTDSRTIKYIAEKSLDATDLSYKSIQGNLFNGLEIKELAYADKPLFDSALIYWNPLTLLSNKITITQVDVKGIEIDNILSMIDDLDSSSNDEARLALDYSFVLNTSHFDINPYVYEGVKFSSFVLETGKIKLAKDLSFDSEVLYLKFDSDIVNVELNGKIEQSRLLIDALKLKDISAKDITRLSSRIKSKGKKSASKNSMPIKEIKIKHILATLKPVQYGDVKIKSVKLDLYDGEINPKNFEYKVKKVKFKGKTNFGLLNYSGHIKKSTIEAKGEILLDKYLFSKYALPLNFNNLRKLPSTLRLNHDAVWIDIEHKVKKPLLLENDLSIDFTEAVHKMHYNYRDKVLSVNSDILGSATYTDVFKLKNNILVDKKGFSYEGNIEIKEIKSLPNVLSEYLLSDIKGEFKGSSSTFEMNLDSSLLSGYFSMPKYKTGNLKLKSKTNNIALDKLIPNLPSALKNERISFESQSFFDFQNLQESEVALTLRTETLDIDAKLKNEKPYHIKFLSRIKNDRLIKEMFPKLKTSKLQSLEGDILFEQNEYIVNIRNNFLKLFLRYDTRTAEIKDTSLNLEGEMFQLQSNHSKFLGFNSRIPNIQDFLEKIQSYYEFEIPNIRGEVDLAIWKQRNGTFNVEIKSPKLQYLSSAGVDLAVTNVHNIELQFEVDEELNIIIGSYQFKLDDNGYLNSFYSTKKAYLSLKGEKLNINDFWINDKIKVTGEYDIDSLIGQLQLDSSAYTLRTKDFTLILDLNLEIKINKSKFDIDGNIDILGDTITYEVMGTDIVEDSDIIIVKDMLRNKESAFNNFKLYLKIKNKKPLKYISDDLHVEFFNEISILKNYNQKMLVTGVSTIDNGYYQLEDKQFILDKSHLYFTGDIKKPLLDIKASYEKEQYNVHVFISGTTDNPIVNFNSEPFLTQQEILSLILFDGTGSSSGKGAEAYTLLGGTFAKGLIKSLGIDVDHLLLGSNSEEELSLEIGKRISKNISVLYLHKDGLDGAKVRIEHSNSFETDIIIQPPNTSSIEFLYKQDR